MPGRREQGSRRTAYALGVRRAQCDRADGIVQTLDQLWRPRGCTPEWFAELQRGYADEMFGAPPNRLQEEHAK